MATSRVLIGLLVGAVVGGGVGFVVGQGGSSQPERGALLPGEASPSGSADPRQSPSLDGIRPAPAVARTVAPAQGSLPGTGQVDEAQVQGIIRDVSTRPAPLEAGDGVISGTVRDTSEVPIAGVVIRAFPSRGGLRARSSVDFAMGAPDLADTRKAAEEAARQILERRASTHEAVTQADGTFSLDSLTEGRWQLKAFKPDYVISAARGQSGSIPLGSVVDFEAVPVERLRVEVLLPDGTPPAEAVLVVSPGSGLDSSEERAHYFGWTPEDPLLPLEEGRWSVRALAERVEVGSSWIARVPSRLASARVEVATGGAETPEVLRLELAGRNGLHGAVSIADDRISASRFRICLMPLVADEELDLEALGRSSRVRNIMFGEEYSFQDLEPGRYAVGVSMGHGRAILGQRVVEVQGELVRADLEIEQVDFSRFLTVYALDTQGEPLDDVQYQFKYEREGSSSSSSISGLDLEDGGRLLCIPPKHLAAFEAPQEGDVFTLSASHNEFGQQSLALAAGQREVTFSFALPATLDVTVTGLGGSPALSRLRVDLSRRSDGVGRYTSTSKELDTAGMTHHEGLEPGAYTLVLRLTEDLEFRWDQPAIAWLDLDLVSGANSTTITLPSLHELAIFAPEEPPTTSVTILPFVEGELNSRRARRIRLDDERRARFEFLPAGEYRVHSGKSGATVTVPGGEVILARPSDQDPGDR